MMVHENPIMDHKPKRLYFRSNPESGRILQDMTAYLQLRLVSELYNVVVFTTSAIVLPLRNLNRSGRAIGLGFEILHLALMLTQYYHINLAIISENV